MHYEHDAPAWTADWINGWLAAIGVTVICPDIKLCWTNTTTPTAIFTTTTPDNIAETIAAHFPPKTFLDDTAIANTAKQHPEDDDYVKGAQQARDKADWYWASSYSDLGPIGNKKEDHYRKSLFYPGVPKGIKLTDRVANIAKQSWGKATDIELSMNGALPRVQGNGLGYDPKRLIDPAYPHSDVAIDPVVESLAVFAMLLFPVRGNGYRTNTRGETNTTRFRWTTWNKPMDLAAIDATFGTTQTATTTYEIEKYAPRGSETNTAYFSRRLKI
jgi:hypothetical protein